MQHYTHIISKNNKSPFQTIGYTSKLIMAAMRITVYAGLLLAYACSGGSEDKHGDVSIPIEERFPIDGVIDFSKLSNIQESDLTFLQIPGLTYSHTTHVIWAIMNDDKNVYIAIQWTDDDYNSNYSLTAGPVDYDSMNLLFDNDGDGTYEDNENRYYTLAASVSATAVDATKSTYQSDAIGNGYSFLKYHADANMYQAEFLLPLEGDCAAESISKNTKINFSISDHIVNDDTAPDPDSGYFTMLVFDEDNSTSWPIMPITDTDPISRTPIPDDLQGLVIFTSAKDDPKGEIYAFDPRTKGITRLTNNSLYEGTISLSHERTRIAFMGASDNPATVPSEAANCEIYILTIGNGTPVKLTTNGFLDGHPAWSPDDSKIVYGCYDPGNQGAHIMLMNADGSNQTDLTLLSDPTANTYWCDEMDPEFTPNGKIVFKTNRYAQTEYYFEHGIYFNSGDSNILHIALMNTDGTSTIRITNETGVVDHDPIANASSTYAVFERLLGDYNYLEIPGCFGPWDIVEVKLDGSLSERNMVHNSWLNWLPVYDPSGNYIVYFRVCGYTESRLIQRSDCKDLGRFIPGVTQFDYLDWK